jgi:hypothetical protein
LAEAYGAGTAAAGGVGTAVGAATGGGVGRAVGAAGADGTAGIAGASFGVACYACGSGYVPFDSGTSLSAIFSIFSSGTSLSV